ncbi:MAG: glycosyltransferase [Proteobacteria bacterium]|nr:glycosyltransferase [Pseudomonadota bacterium]
MRPCERPPRRDRTRFGCSGTRPARRPILAQYVDPPAHTAYAPDIVSSMRNLRVLLVHGTFGDPGGGNAVGAWLAQALADAVTLDVLTELPWEPASVDAFWGTSLARHPLRQHVVPMPASLLLRLRYSLNRERPGTRFDRLRLALLFREARRLGPRFDLCVTAENFAAFDRPGIQYVHYPAIFRPEPLFAAPLVRRYYDVCDALSGLTRAVAAGNVTLTNSQWTARALGEMGFAARVVYPPVFDPGPGVAWHERDDAVLCLGRFHPTKRMEGIMAIVARVRESHPGLTLRFIGSPVDTHYTTQMRALATDHGDWITFHENPPRSALIAMLGRARYGIHAMEKEHFGMAPAEMTRAGMLVFCHRSGGLVEVVDREERLLWTDDAGAVARMRELLGGPEEARAALSARLRAYSSRFSMERFCREVHDAVRESAATLNRGPAGERRVF